VCDVAYVVVILWANIWKNSSVFLFFGQFLVSFMWILSYRFGK